MIGTHKPAIPCRRPKVDVENLGHTRSEKWETWSAGCKVPGCDWSYENIAKTDVEQTAVGHRAWHRNAVPSCTVRIRLGGGYTVVCECGFVRQDGTTTTRSDAQRVEAHHLSNDHGLVTCS